MLFLTLDVRFSRVPCSAKRTAINPSILFVLKINRVQTFSGNNDKSDGHLQDVSITANIEDAERIAECWR